MTNSPRQFEAMTIVYNPKSSRARTAKLRIKEAKAIFGGKVRAVETSPDGQSANVKLIRRLAAQVGQNGIIGVVAGDGTVNAAVEALVSSASRGKSTSATRLQCVLLPLWGGNANDLASMLNGDTPNRPLAEILDQASVQQIHPLSVEVTESGAASKQYYAACYVSFGASAYTAARLNRASYRKHPLYKVPGLHAVRESMYVLRHFSRSPRFSVRYLGRSHKLHELLFANGSRMAKFNQLPAKLDQKKYYMDSLQYGHFGRIIRKLFLLSRGGVTRNHRSKALTLTFESDTWMQLDGEPIQVAKGSKVVIGLHSTAFRALATELH